MADKQVRADIQARFVDILDACDKKEFKRAAMYFTENCWAMFNDHQTYKGRTELMTGLATVVKSQMIAKSVLKELNHFEMHADNTAYTVMFVDSVDQSGRTVAKFRIIGLWRLIDSAWYMEHNFMNYRETSPRDKAFQEIKQASFAAYEKMSNQDLEGFLKVEAENVTVMMNGRDEMVGKKTLRDLLPQMLTTKTKYELAEISYFDLLDEDTAFTIYKINVIKPSGQHSSTIRDCFLWKKIGENWQVVRDAMNVVPQK